MKIWTLSEMRSKVFDDDDLNDESFITADELVGYFNEGIDEAEAEIITLSKDYFLTKYYLPLAVGTAVYTLPENIFANKIRSIIFKDGAEIYEVKKLRGPNMFAEIARIDQYGSAEEYRYLLTNHNTGQAQLELKPTSRDAAVYSSSYPMVLWYLRNANRIPITGEYCNPETVLPASVDVTTNVITVTSGTTTYGNAGQCTIGCSPGSITYVTGDKVKLAASFGGTLPAPLVAGTVYYVIAVSSTTIKLATTLANALVGTAIDITTQGTVFFTIYVAATADIISATLIDIPEFANFIMQWVKTRAMGKEGDPRQVLENEIAEGRRKLMVDTLTETTPDDANEVLMDTSHYQESN